VPVKAEFAAGGKPLKKKDLGLMAMTYGYVYVAQNCDGAKVICRRFEPSVKRKLGTVRH